MIYRSKHTAGTESRKNRRKTNEAEKDMDFGLIMMKSQTVSGFGLTYDPNHVIENSSLPDLIF